MLEEPYELIAHVRLCGEVDRATGRLYPELLDRFAKMVIWLFVGAYLGHYRLRVLLLEKPTNTSA